VIDAGVKLFLAKGFAGTSVSDIAAAVGLSKGTMYWHFKSKDEILNCILDRYSEEFLQGLISALNGCDGDFLTRFRLFYRYTTEFARDHRELLLVFNTLLGEIVGNHSSEEKRMKELQREYIHVVEQLVEQGKREGVVRSKSDSLIQAHIIAATLTGMLLQWYLYADTLEDTARYARGFRDALLGGLGILEVPARSSSRRRSSNKMRSK
jgi:AcrR family transcriptional regulator